MPQGSVLEPLMFLVNINDMMERKDSYMSLFVDDVKLLRRVKGKEDCKRLREDMNVIYEWTKRGEMKFNTSKCHTMRTGMK